jgi:ACR3 family arsenite transporter
MKTSDEKQPHLAFFEKYLTLWVSLCIILGIGLGKVAPHQMALLSQWTFYSINLPVAVLVWLMIYPMMVQIDFGSITRVGQNWKGLTITLIVNWLIKPFSMAFFAWLFFEHLYQAYLTPEEAKSYLAGAILLGAAPCTAMVFVWSYLTRGDANYTLVQVSVNDLVLLVAFVPIVRFLLGISEVPIPYDVLLASVVVFVVIPLLSGYLSNRYLIASRGEAWFKSKFLKNLKPVSTTALLSTLLLLFAFQGEKILANPLAILLIALPLTLQTYFVFFLTWGLGRWAMLSHAVCAPSAMIGASNFFELAVAVAIALFGLDSGAALATVVGVLIEVPVMLSLVALSNRWRY